MLTCANKVLAQNIRYLPWSSEPVAELYQRLSDELERVRQAQSWVQDPRMQVCLAVLSEDLEALLEQCENHLYLSHLSDCSDISLLHALGKTVLEEVTSVLPLVP